MKESTIDFAVNLAPYETREIKRPSDAGFKTRRLVVSGFRLVHEIARTRVGRKEWSTHDVAYGPPVTILDVKTEETACTLLVRNDSDETVYFHAMIFGVAQAVRS